MIKLGNNTVFPKEINTLTGYYCLTSGYG